MNNAALQALITEFGERICMIIFDNNNKIHIGYQSSPITSVNDLVLKAYGGVDFVGVPRHAINPADRAKGVSAVIWHPTECVQSVVVMDEGAINYRLDPWDIG